MCNAWNHRASCDCRFGGAHPTTGNRDGGSETGLPEAGYVLDSHDRIIATTGGEPGILNAGAIDSALERARWGPFKDGDFAERMAFLIRGIVQDHPFADGNKRAAYAAFDVSIAHRSATLTASDEETTAFFMALAQGDLEFDEIVAWIRSHLWED
ncbi:MAG: type II toxin-antitoxin system death-on-curing family toxin [Thermoplasmatota archaeon]